jgi:hypothetical protein
MHSVDKIDIMLKKYNDKKKKASFEFKKYIKPKKAIANHLSKPKIRNKKKESPVFVYIIKAIGTTFHKIGVSANPKKRLKDLQTGNPYKLMVKRRWKFPLKSTALITEKELHIYLSKHKCSGGKEWFRNDNNIINQIESLIAKEIR